MNMLMTLHAGRLPTTLLDPDEVLKIYRNISESTFMDEHLGWISLQQLMKVTTLVEKGELIIKVNSKLLKYTREIFSNQPTT